MSHSEFKTIQRVGWSDTDASGVVYHPNYAKYMEISRTEWLRRFHIGQTGLERLGIYFVARELNMKFKRPGRMDDILTIGCILTSAAGQMLGGRHIIRKDEQVLVIADWKLVCVSTKDFRPTLIPREIAHIFENELEKDLTLT